MWYYVGSAKELRVVQNSLPVDYLAEILIFGPMELRLVVLPWVFVIVVAG